MMEPTDPGGTHRIASLLRSAVLMACLVAILVGACDLMLPTGWSAWQSAILIATAGGLAMVLGRPGRRAASTARPGGRLALLFGATSLVLGIGAAILIAYSLFLRISEERTSPQTLVHRLHYTALAQTLMMFVLPVAVSGGLGLWIAGRREPSTARTSLVAAARRFSTVGLWIAGLITVALAVAVFYRWLMWG